MDNYFEQSVAGDRGPREQLKYAACWAGIVLLVLTAMISALNILGVDSERVFINWMNVIVLVAAIALAVILYRAKDKVYREYDYILWNSELEVCVVFNRKRRKKVATIQLGHVHAWGPVGAMEKQMYGAKRHSWCAHMDKAWCMVYSGEGGKAAALMEFNDEMCGELRATSRAMRDCEVKP